MSNSGECNDCGGPGENRHGLCKECQDYWRKRALAGIRNKFYQQRKEEEEDVQTGLGDFV